mmetsp:Transcript_45755/g.74648  ORF Transcript_45755/g.74648 Transcript_45755/m.74648 type:complete len:379 (+) Transcript_45755:93-1229(+)
MASAALDVASKRGVPRPPSFSGLNDLLPPLPPKALKNKHTVVQIPPENVTVAEEVSPSSTLLEGTKGKVRRASVATARVEAYLAPPPPRIVRPSKSCPPTPNVGSTPATPSACEDIELHKSGVYNSDMLSLPAPNARRLSQDSASSSRRSSFLSGEIDLPDAQVFPVSMTLPGLDHCKADDIECTQEQRALKEGGLLYASAGEWGASFFVGAFLFLSILAAVFASMHAFLVAQGLAHAGMCLFLSFLVLSMALVLFVWHAASRQYQVYPDRLEIVRSPLSHRVVIPFSDIIFVEHSSALILRPLLTPLVFVTSFAKGLVLYTRSRSSICVDFGVALTPLHLSDFHAHFSDALAAFYERNRPSLTAGGEAASLLRGTIE